MLKLPRKYTDDKKVEALIEWNLRQNILELVKNEILDYEKSQRKEAQEDDSAFCNALRDFFPEHYPVEKRGKVFFRLKLLLESEYEFCQSLSWSMPCIF